MGWFVHDSLVFVLIFMVEEFQGHCSIRVVANVNTPGKYAAKVIFI